MGQHEWACADLPTILERVENASCTAVMKTAHFARLQFGESGGSASDRVVAKSASVARRVEGRSRGAKRRSELMAQCRYMPNQHSQLIEQAAGNKSNTI